jgi:hypothetical protein
MPDASPDFGLATAGQLRRAGFHVEPTTTDDSATTGFEVLASHGDEHSRGEFEKARERGDHLPGGKGKS